MFFSFCGLIVGTCPKPSVKPSFDLPTATQSGYFLGPRPSQNYWNPSHTNTENLYPYIVDLCSGVFGTCFSVLWLNSWYLSQTISRTEFRPPNPIGLLFGATPIPKLLKSSWIITENKTEFRNFNLLRARPHSGASPILKKAKIWKSLPLSCNHNTYILDSIMYKTVQFLSDW